MEQKVGKRSTKISGLMDLPLGPSKASVGPTKLLNE